MSHPPDYKAAFHEWRLIFLVIKQEACGLAKGDRRLRIGFRQLSVGSGLTEIDVLPYGSLSPHY